MIPVNDLRRGFRLYQDEYEKKAIDVLRSGRYILGEEVSSFEKEFADSLGDGCYCAGVDNGCDAIWLGLKASGLKSDDEIIVQANGYIASLLGIIHCGAKPVFVEPDEYYQMDVNKIEAAVTSHTRGVLVTHLYGLATRMNPIINLCDKYNLRIYEDCAQAHYSTYNGMNAGTFGDVAFFSFYPTKNLGAFGDGGAVISRDKDIIEKVKVLRNYGSDRRYHNIEIGYNARLDEMQAGLLRVKMRHIFELLENRECIAQRYLSEINNPGIELPKIPAECKHRWYQFVVRVDSQNKFRQFLDEKGICTDIAWEVPPYLQPCIAEQYGYQKGDYPITDDICSHVVSLPMMDYMSEDEITKVVDAVNEYK